MKSEMRAAIYARRSDPRKEKEVSIMEQVEACRQWIRDHGHTVAREYVETRSGVTGAGRPEFLAMIEHAEARAFDAIVTLDVSRFGRFDVNERGYWIHRLTIAGVEVHHVHDDEKLQGEAGPIMGAVLQASAREHSVKTALRASMGIRAAIERKTWHGSRPYGYHLVRRPDWEVHGRKEARLAIVDKEAAIVRRIFVDYDSGPFSPRKIAGSLNAENVPSPSGRQWSRSSVIFILGNPIYAGDRVIGQRRHGRTLRKRARFYRVSAGGPVRAGENAQPIVQRDVFPSIVSRELWNRVQERLDSRATKPTGGLPHALSGIARCGVCSGPMVSLGHTGRGKRYSYYVCGRCRQRGLSKSWGDCARVNVKAPGLEEAVLGALRAVAASIDPKRLAAELRAALPGLPRVDVTALEAQRRRLAVRRDQLLLSDGGEFVEAGIAKLAEEDARLAREIERARSAEASGGDVDALVAEALTAARLLLAPTTDDAREGLRDVLRLFVKRLEIGPSEPRKPRPVTLEVYTPKGIALSPDRPDIPPRPAPDQMAPITQAILGSEYRARTCLPPAPERAASAVSPEAASLAALARARVPSPPARLETARPARP